MEVTPRQLDLLHHTLGVTARERAASNGHFSDRNHFVTGKESSDYPHLQELVQMGLMEVVATPGFCDSADILFRATDLGGEYAMLNLPKLPAPRKMTNFERFQDADTGWSFGEYLCGDRQPKFERHAGWNVPKRWRMSRGYGNEAWHVCGEWRPTQREARASYKEALKAYQQSHSA